MPLKKPHFPADGNRMHHNSLFAANSSDAAGDARVFLPAAAGTGSSNTSTASRCSVEGRISR
jgi:hypothetical protein